MVGRVVAMVGLLKSSVMVDGNGWKMRESARRIRGRNRVAVDEVTECRQVVGRCIIFIGGDDDWRQN
jgi:hypothetical protein